MSGSFMLSEQSITNTKRLPTGAVSNTGGTAAVLLRLPSGFLLLSTAPTAFICATHHFQ
ncbi:MAG: hypothetical protein M5U25_03025 [Planctomycetota bacterium]|nr:hypothetical protein [Planctomycetota bacterium]